MKSSKPHPVVEIDGWHGESLGIVYAVIGSGKGTLRTDHLAGEVWSVKRGEWWAKDSGTHEVMAVKARSAHEAAMMLSRSVAAVQFYDRAVASGTRVEQLAIERGAPPMAAFWGGIAEFKRFMEEEDSSAA